jgi:peptidoglycan hydrolase-like protein with peptidoglycan-binding domain
VTVPARRPPTSRRAREAAIAVVLLPVLLLVGILVGTKVFGHDSTPSTTTASGATPSPSRSVAGPVAPTTAAPVGPVAPSVTAAPTTPAPAPTTAAPAPTTAAPAPTVQATTAAPAPAPTTAAPAPAPSSGSGTGTQAGGSTGGGLAISKAPVPRAGARVVFGPGSAGSDVRAWQQRMAARGWNIHVDGIYGPQTASVAKRFQAEKHLTADGLVGPQTWNAAWKLPVTPP